MDVQETLSNKDKCLTVKEKPATHLKFLLIACDINILLIRVRFSLVTTDNNFPWASSCASQSQHELVGCIRTDGKRLKIPREFARTHKKRDLIFYFQDNFI